MSPDELSEKERQDRDAKYGQPLEEQAASSLAAYIQRVWYVMRDHRSSQAGWNWRLIAAQRAFNREYDPRKLAEIREFSGSEVYAGMVATKCRGATALLREVYLDVGRPWGLDPTPEPTLPEPIQQAIQELVEAEVRQLVASGQQIDPMAIQDRLQGLVDHALAAGKRKAREQAERAEDAVDDYLVEGGFYEALADFLVHLPIFPFACMKGPVVRVVPSVKWTPTPQGPKAVQQDTAKMFWNCVSPFDIYFTPGVSDIRDGDVIEINRFTRADLNSLIGVPGYIESEIRNVLRDYGTRGWKSWTDPTDSERAIGENRESPSTNNSGIIDCIEFHGSVQGKLLLEWGFTDDEVDDPDLDYFIQAWMIGRYVIKAQIHPSPRKRAPYFVTSFEKVPGTPVGNALPDILGSIEDVSNATLRAIVNNMAMSSGPQVVLNDDRLAPGSNSDELFPWKRWHTQDNPLNRAASGLAPITFFQPNDNSAQYFAIFERLTALADDLSAIPRYVTGASNTGGGAGRTASGLAMLMGNANKILKNVCANIDRDVIEPLIQMLYDFLMLTDQTGMFRGDESIQVRGVQVAVQRETNRQRQMELLQATLNPVDQQIMGPLGRRALLYAVAQEVGLPGEEIVPTEDELKDKMQQAAVAAQQQAQAAQQQQIEQDGQRSLAPPTGVAPKGANTDLGRPEMATTQGMVN
jgi:hypothetical protein